MSAATLTELKSAAVVRREAAPNVTMGFGSSQSFELMQRAANLLSSSTLVPAAYRKVVEKLDKYGNVKESRENPNALANSVVALNMAQRMGADPLMVMQNLYIVEGRPSWSSQWIIAAVNGCGRFSPLRFDIKVIGKKVVERVDTVWENGNRSNVVKKVEIIDKVAIAWAVERETKERLESPPVSIEMAVKEGWYTKNGSKWQTMDEVMLRYRTASFFGKLYAPELLMGLQSVEEAQDIIDLNPDGSYTVASTSVDELRGRARPADVVHQGGADPMNSQPGWQDGAYDAERDPAQPVHKQAAASTEGEKQEASTAQAADGELPLDDGQPAGNAGAAGGEPPLTFNEVKTELLTAGTVEDLDYARSLIKQIPDEEAKATLNSIAARRMSELTKKDEPAAAAAQPRRARAPINAD